MIWIQLETTIWAVETYRNTLESILLVVLKTEEKDKLNILQKQKEILRTRSDQIHDLGSLESWASGSSGSLMLGTPLWTTCSEGSIVGTFIDVIMIDGATFSPSWDLFLCVVRFVCCRSWCWSKLYMASILNTDLTFWHPQLILGAVRY